MKKVLVIGIGNKLMMDDGIGVYVVEELKKRNTSPGIRYVIGETDVYYCLDQIEESSHTVIVDAAYLGNKPGTISAFPLQEALKKRIQLISVHEAHLLHEINITGKYINGLLVGIEPGAISYSSSLSPILQTQFSKIVEEVENIFTNYLIHEAREN